MSDVSSTFPWATVDAALAHGDASGAAATALEGLRASPFDRREQFFSQLSLALLPRARAPETASCVAEACEALWGMPEFRSNRTSASSVTGEALLLAVVLATAYTTVDKLEKAIAFDAAVLQSSAFFTYEGLTPLERLACVARVLKASRITADPRHTDSAVQKGMSLYHGIADRARYESGDDEVQRHRHAVVCTYLLELGLYRQERHDYLRAFQSFFALHENREDAVVLQRSALCALCVRASEAERQAALYSVTLRGKDAFLTPSLYHYVQVAYNGQLFSAADVEGVLATAGPYLPQSILRSALREHNIIILAKTFECVHWRSLCVHMDDEGITEGELYDLLVSMVQAQRVSAAIYQDTGFIEFTNTAKAHAQITDTDAFNRISAAATAIGKARPELLLV
ncbi:conserved hypothetical protein [Leishmania braziliensis MHOM/BR/75/M2904]|uniref:Cop9 signalosome complex subunit n=2 Tax=Leishmania braziliensis TaxID=5660 RepID=A4HQH2_LEIBR|nr:conserved hypothetical protein [Leishmania braziliensis MHOM/BR/75/M2904]CAJ2482306.1 unnamed protein product [Leishmania braziliensis]CAJ2482566.1 unnamed protein product [Leishmania braziliensis]CAM44438.1 conserved hypothetical protein [Leishmania braziliensis MHOM/BR/75/M2904]SYZ70517.1 cop9_signalosome_complex_subunit [Leishmania braziliensis MHOM/BR/75/M2904]